MRNLVEIAVRDTHRELLKTRPEFCSCAQCADDVVTYTLNHIRPRYATSARGWAIEQLELQSDQTRAELLVAVIEAAQKVAAAPRHGAQPAR